MTSRIGPRSVKDATRFTSTVPHATSKSAGRHAAAMPTPQSRIPGETPEQRVKRLRLAHLAAQKAQISRTDRVVDASRRFLDVAHRWTVGGIVLFTAVAGVVSIYSVWDMLRYNRARRAEWIEAQRTLEADSLSAARVAYLKGEATEEQIALVEEANREAEEKGTKLPPLLSPPEHRTHFEERVKPAFQSADHSEGKGKGVLGILSGLWGGSQSGDGSSQVAASDDQSGTGGVVRSIETTAKQAWDAEKEKQRKGGSLDQLGLDSATSSPAPSVKKRWWPW
ncbi:cytochrome oxidase c assembly domain-containing protein [Hirsutella rhossiliensis]|uniref:Cytochrome oxidase c assembly domain-containing protein n=1 Tax=Hirsutella rhossiliensis TaxID=111463 RepID=A0A9P8MWI1_9HYPO|nr:cytochrome oxidase c assembly domain-containing protein [Hirsutella rhossiliensis]KAH0961511.1 cytochrome oxidase c assembly domain-containing protein [Hirsutella rhossiliensis]